MAGRGRPKKPRPDGWSKQFILDWMEFHPGANIMPFLERLAKDVRGCQAGTLYMEIARWRKKDSEFRERYAELMDGRHAIAGNRYAEVLALERRPGMEDWRLEAAFAYLRDRSKVSAANASGISPSHLRNKLNPNGPDYDEELAHLFREVEQILLWAKEEDLEWAINEAKCQGDARTVGQLALAVLERLDKAKWSKSEERQVHHSGTVVHQHVLAERQIKAMEEASVISQKLFGGGARELPEHQEPVEIEVVEAEYVEEKHAAEG